MPLIIRLLIFIIGFSIGLLILRYLDKVAGITGRNSWAEEKFGSGGTYLMLQLVGVGIMVVSFIAAMFL